MKYKHITLLKTFILTSFLAVLPATGFAQKDHKIPFGKKGVLVIDGKTHTISVIENSKEISSAASASFRVNGILYSVTDYPEPTYRSEKINDTLGNGIKYTFTYRAADKPVLEQIFTTYKEHEYFITQLLISANKGGGVSTNYIAPYTSGLITFDEVKNLHTVFVPYDNDAFISYDSKKLDTIKQNNSAEVGLVFNNESRNGFIIGSLEHTVWKSGVQTNNNNGKITIDAWAGYAEKTVTRDSIPHGMVKGGNVSSPKMFVGYFDDWRQGMEEYGKANRAVEKPFVFNWGKPTPVGWNSWGVLMDKITYENTTAVANFFANEVPHFRVGNIAYIDLDSFWDNFVKGGFDGDFSRVKQFADYCKSKGLEPGVYWAPFTDWGWKAGPDRKVTGSNYTYGDIWTKTGNTYFDFDGARATDPTHPGTLQHIDYVINKLKACGFKMIKIDFLGHAAAESTAFYDKNVTTGMQAYKIGMERLIKDLDGQMLVYAAISPSLATSRYAHMRRIACDAWKTIEHTQYTLNSVNYGWWQTYTYNYIDADHVVFANESEGENRARLISAVITGTLITGDDYSKQGNWSNKAKQWLQNEELLKIVADGKAFRPVEANTGKKTSESFVHQIGGNWYIALFNYGKEAKSYAIPLSRLGIADGSYKLTDILGGTSTIVTGTVNAGLGAKDGHIYKLEKL